MLSQVAEITRLSLLIERLLDAERLPDREGAILLRKMDAARQSLEAGELEMARSHLEQIALFTDTLTQTGTLARADGRAILQAANDILNVPPDGGNAPC